MKKGNTAVGKKGQSPQLIIGIDLGDRTSRYCVLDEAGKILLEQEVETRPEALKKKFSAMDRSRIAIEAGHIRPGWRGCWKDVSMR